MYTVFVIGNIASGKSTASRYLVSRGARLIDLDALAKDLYVPGSDLVDSLAREFGFDILDVDGAVRTGVLAHRAFASPESVDRLNALVHPAVLEKLANLIMPVPCCSVVVPDFPFTVVEVSAASAVADALGLADSVLAITVPLEVRRERAIARGMLAEDFDARALAQPSEEELCALADDVIDNTAADDSLFTALDAWLDDHGICLEDCRRLDV